MPLDTDMGALKCLSCEEKVENSLLRKSARKSTQNCQADRGDGRDWEDDSSRCSSSQS